MAKLQLSPEEALQESVRSIKQSARRHSEQHRTPLASCHGYHAGLQSKFMACAGRAGMPQLGEEWRVSSRALSVQGRRLPLLHLLLLCCCYSSRSRTPGRTFFSRWLRQIRGRRWWETSFERLPAHFSITTMSSPSVPLLLTMNLFGSSV